MGCGVPSHIGPHEPSLGLLEVVECLGKDPVELTRNYGNEVRRVQEIGFVPVWVPVCLAFQIPSLSLLKGAQNPLAPPVVGVAGNKPVLYEPAHGVSVQLESLTQGAVVTLYHRRPPSRNRVVTRWRRSPLTLSLEVLR